MNPATVDESRIPLRPWWKNQYVIHDIVMSSLLIVFNVAIFSYIRHHKIHIAVPTETIVVFSVWYFLSFIYGVAVWVHFFSNNMPERFEGGLMGVSHVYALVILILFIYAISPVFSLFFGIPSALWQNQYVIHDIVMSSLLIVFNVAIFSYIRHHKIHIAVATDTIVSILVLYCLTFICGVAVWVCIFSNNKPERFQGIMGVSHVYALVILMLFIYAISPGFSLFLGIPSGLWFVSYLAYTSCRPCVV